MIGLDAAHRVPPDHLETYAARLLAALDPAHLAVALDPRDAFRHWYASWSTPSELSGEASDTERTHRAVARALPCFAELVLTLRAQRPTVAWLSGGRSGASLAETVSSLLHSTLAAHLAAGGERAMALTLAELFATTFPEIERLRDLSPLAQAFLVGVAPRADGHALKVYLNPRVTGAAGASRLREMAAVAGAEPGRFESLLTTAYPDAGESTHLYGLGADLVAGAAPRTKLYVRMDAPRASALLDDFAPPAAFRHLLTGFDHPALTGSTEVALALHGEAQSFKLTRFWTGRQMDGAQEREIVAWLAELGLPSEGLAAMVTALRAPSPPVLQRSPIHAVGLEARSGAELKVNVYLQPEL